MARYNLILRMDILHSTGVLLKCNSLPLTWSGITAALRGVLLTFGKMQCSASLDGYGLMAIPGRFEWRHWKTQYLYFYCLVTPLSMYQSNFGFG